MALWVSSQNRTIIKMAIAPKLKLNNYLFSAIYSSRVLHGLYNYIDDVQHYIETIVCDLCVWPTIIDL